MLALTGRGAEGEGRRSNDFENLKSEIHKTFMHRLAACCLFAIEPRKRVITH
jgi:hypothetical protein